MKKREVCAIASKAVKKGKMTKERYLDIKEGMKRINDKDNIFSSLYLMKIWNEIEDL